MKEYTYLCNVQYIDTQYVFIEFGTVYTFVSPELNQDYRRSGFLRSDYPRSPVLREKTKT